MRKRLSLLSWSWLLCVTALSLVGIVGSIPADPLLRYVPDNTVFYASRKVDGGRSAIVIQNDGNTVHLKRIRGVVSVESDGKEEQSFRDKAFYKPSPFENLRIHSHESVALFLLPGMKQKEVAYGSKATPLAFTTRFTPDSPLLGTSVTSLPASLTLWSTEGEPIPAIERNARLQGAKAEGMYTASDEKELVMRTTKAEAETILRTIAARNEPTRKTLRLPDETLAREFIGDPQKVELEEEETPLGTVLFAKNQTAGAISIGEEDALLFSSKDAAKESTPFSPNCPIQSVTTFVRSPFFLFGTTEAKKYMLCLGEF